MGSVASTRKRMAGQATLLALAILTSVGLVGCVDGAGQADSYALAGLSTELKTLKHITDLESSRTDSPEVVAQGIQGGTLGRVFPDRLDPAFNPGSSFVAIYDVSTTENTVTFHAVLQSSGVSGGGWTYKERARFICLAVGAQVPRHQSKATVKEVDCRSDIEDLLRARTDNDRASLSQLAR